MVKSNLVMAAMRFGKGFLRFEVRTVGRSHRFVEIGVRGHLTLYFVMRPLAKARKSVHPMIAKSPLRAHAGADGF